MIFREKVMVFSQPGALPEGALRDVVSKVENLDMVDGPAAGGTGEAGSARLIH
jgi:hypothetical protein